MSGLGAPSPRRTRVLVLSQDVIGPHMAGPGMRYWELARVLARTCEVALAAPLSGPPPSSELAVHPLTLGDPREVMPLLAQADTVISNGFLLYHYPQLADIEIPWVIDAYIPSPTEGLAFYAGRPLADQAEMQARNREMLNRFFARGDLFLCASERQRDLYLGVLAAVGRLNPHTYAQDSTFRKLIDVVPFGLPSEPPIHCQPVFKGVQHGVAPTDRVILWGGGLWDWLDPLTLIEAIAHIATERTDVRLYFPGTRHPFTAQVPDTSMRRRAIALSDRLGLTDRFVFFGDWLPHEARASYLLEADIGVSLHPEGIEPRYAFRTRVLDYIWAGLPMVVTAGDVLAEQVAAKGLGLVVRPRDVDGVAAALLALLREPDARAARHARFREIAGEMTWERVAEPLVRFCQHPQRAADWDAPAHKATTNPAEFQQLHQDLCQAQQRILALEQLIAAYERGRLMRLMATIKRWRSRFTARGQNA